MFKNQRFLFKIKGISFIEIPYWWDRQYSSLAATIYSHRPDLFNDVPMGDRIPLFPPPSRSQSDKNTKLMMLSTVWDESKDPTGWY